MTELPSCSDRYGFAISDKIIDYVQPFDMNRDKQPIFHYCSAETLTKVLQSKKLRFSDATCLNDGEEIIWAERQVQAAVRRLRDREGVADAVPAISKAFFDDFNKAWKKAVSSYRPFICCFSKSGDNLSQWRAYADDAKGFSIGFLAERTDTPAIFFSVEYDPISQQNDAINILVLMYQNYKKFPDYIAEQMQADIDFMFSYSTRYKNPAFADEREVRAIHLTEIKENKNGERFLSFLGGVVADQEINEGEIQFGVRKDRIVPYVDFDYQLESEFPITEIWRGPRCATPLDDMVSYVRTIGLGDVKLKNAGSNYR